MCIWGNYLDIYKAIVLCFQLFDKNGDGYISAEELYLVMTQLGEKLSMNDASEMMKEADTNGDGLIDYKGQ